jgi:hypothetical protein
MGSFRGGSIAKVAEPAVAPAVMEGVMSVFAANVGDLPEFAEANFVWEVSLHLEWKAG